MTAPTHVKLSISLEAGADCILHTPLVDIHRLTTNPIKWLLYVAFTITGCFGKLSTQLDGASISSDDECEIVGAEYFYIPNVTNTGLLIDITGLDDRVSLASSRQDPLFKEILVARDQSCLFSDWAEDGCQGCHIIPHSMGDEFITNLVANRICFDESERTIERINDVRNGLLLIPQAHRRFGHSIVLLKTPNSILQPEDVHGPSTKSRMTFQWLDITHTSPSSMVHDHPTVDWDSIILPDGKDVSGFTNPAPSSMPAGVLLDYMYGCAVVLKWGTKSFHDFLQYRTPSLAASGDTAAENSIASPLARGKRAIERASGADPWDDHYQVRTSRSPSQDEVLDWMLYISKRLRGGDCDEGHVAESKTAEVLKQTEIREQSASCEKVKSWLPTLIGSSSPL